MKGIPVSAKGQIVIPKEIRDRLGIKPGDRVDFVEYGRSVYFMKVPEDPIAASYGMLKGGPDSLALLLQDRREECEREEREMEEDRRRRLAREAEREQARTRVAESEGTVGSEYSGRHPTDAPNRGGGRESEERGH